MSPVSVRTFDFKNSKTVSEHFFSMCLTEGEDAGKASKLFEAIKESFEGDEIPWSNCASLSLENTNVMLGKQNSRSRFIKILAEKSQYIYWRLPLTSQQVMPCI